MSRDDRNHSTSQSDDEQKILDLPSASTTADEAGSVRGGTMSAFNQAETLASSFKPQVLSDKATPKLMES